MSLPLRGTPTPKFTANEFNLDAFLEVCSEYEFDSFLEENSIRDWMDFFNGEFGDEKVTVSVGKKKGGDFQ